VIGNPDFVRKNADFGRFASKAVSSTYIDNPFIVDSLEKVEIDRSNEKIGKQICLGITPYGCQLDENRNCPLDCAVIEMKFANSHPIERKLFDMKLKNSNPRERAIIEAEIYK